jgi:hypothetical protein
MSMAEVIEFEILARFTPRIKWLPTGEQREKVIPFLSHREASDKAVCAPHEELDSESSQSLRLEEQSFTGLFECNGEDMLDLVHTGPFLRP